MNQCDHALFSLRIFGNWMAMENDKFARRLQRAMENQPHGKHYIGEGSAPLTTPNPVILATIHPLAVYSAPVIL